MRLRWRFPRRCARTLTLRARHWIRAPRTQRSLVKRLMQTDSLTGRNEAASLNGQPTATPALGAQETAQDQSQTRKRILLVRHGQTTYNVEKRLPGQLPGVALTEVGRRQAHRAAVALSGLPLSAVVSSPLERARDTAAIIARGWGLAVRTDDRLMDTDVGGWSGRVLEEIEKTDPAWKAFVAHPSQAPEGVESLAAVMARAAAVVEELRRDPTAGEYIALVAHADVVKLIVAHYCGIQVDCAPWLRVDNAAITALGFDGERPPVLLALNWTPLPDWLIPWQKPGKPGAEAAQPLPAGVEHANGASQDAASQSGSSATEGISTEDHQRASTS